MYGKNNLLIVSCVELVHCSCGQVNDRIMHHVRTNAGLNSNQYGFIPQRGTVDGALAVKEIIDGNLKQKNCTSVVSLDVRGAFDAAWWSSILRNLKEIKCPKNLLNLPRSYFSDRTGIC